MGRGFVFLSPLLLGQSTLSPLALFSFEAFLLFFCPMGCFPTVLPKVHVPLSFSGWSCGGWHRPEVFSPPLTPFSSFFALWFPFRSLLILTHLLFLSYSPHRRNWLAGGGCDPPFVLLILLAFLFLPSPAESHGPPTVPSPQKGPPPLRCISAPGPPAIFSLIFFSPCLSGPPHPPPRLVPFFPFPAFIILFWRTVVLFLW